MGFASLAYVCVCVCVCARGMKGYFQMFAALEELKRSNIELENKRYIITNHEHDIIQRY